MALYFVAQHQHQVELIATLPVAPDARGEASPPTQFADRSKRIRGTDVYLRETHYMSISLVLAVLALVVALINAANGRAPLWIAVALLALAMIIPGTGLLRSL